MSAGANPSTSTKGIRYDAVTEFTVCAEESLGSEILRVGVLGFVTCYGPDRQRMNRPGVQDDRHSYSEN